MAEQLSQLLKTDLPSGPVGYKATMQTQAPFMQRKEELQKGLTETEGDIAKATQAQAETREAGKLEAQKGFGAAEKGAMQGYQQKMEDEPLPAFVPTKDTAQDLAGLFSIVSVIGMIAGKGDAQRALGAMNGMLEGHQKGRADLYKKESIEFEKNFKSMQKKHEEFRKEMEDAIKLASTNKEAGMQAAELAATKAGSDIVKAQLRKGDLVGAYKLVDETQKGVGEAVKAEARVREKAADRAVQEERMKLQRELAEFKANNSSKATQQQFIVQRSVNALGGVASAVEAINRLPAGTTAGILPNLTTKDGMVNYMRNAAGRTFSKSEEKAVETLFTGITRNLAAIEASGAATGLTGLATQLEKLRPVAGDKAIDVALKMADIRRIATENIQPLIDSGLMPKQQAETAKLLVNRIEAAVPYTANEVVDAINVKGKKTMGEASAEIAKPPKSFASEAEAEDAFKAGNLKTGEKVMINGVRGTWE
jgi:hypothetical protein